MGAYNTNLSRPTDRIPENPNVRVAVATKKYPRNPAGRQLSQGMQAAFSVTTITAANKCRV